MMFSFSAFACIFCMFNVFSECFTRLVTIKLSRKDVSVIKPQKDKDTVMCTFGIICQSGIFITIF